VHETAHQWFACLVGTDSINEAYLDEGLATFSTLLYYKLTGDEGSYADNLKQLRNAYVAFMMLEQARQPSYKPKMTKPLHAYKSAYEYEILCYNKSAIMFATLYEVMGKDAFLKGLATFYTQNCYGLAKCSQLIAATSSKRFDSAKILTPFLEGDAIITAIMV